MINRNKKFNYNKIQIPSSIRIGLNIFIMIMLLNIILVDTFPNVSAYSTWSDDAYNDFYYGIYDNVRRRSIGDDAGLILENDFVWFQKSPATNPGRLYSAQMVNINATDKMMLFGGLEDSTRKGDTWIYDISADKWEIQAISGPGARSHFAMTGFIDDNFAVLYGGGDTGIKYNDTWIYNFLNNSWTKKSPVNTPGTRSNHAMASVYGTDKVVLFGGYNATTGINGDTWIYDRTNDNWTEQVTHTSPAARTRHAMATIYGTDKVALFGGYLGYWDSQNHYSNQIWIYDLSENNWTLLGSLNNRPAARDLHGLATVYGTHKVVMFGGSKGSMGAYVNDTWVYDFDEETWIEAELTSAPARRSSFMFASVHGTEKVILFAGAKSGTDCNDTWIFDTSKYFNTGTYSSSVHVLEHNTSLIQISWNATTNPSSHIKFQLRTAMGYFNLLSKDFIGPDGTVNTYYESSPTDIWLGHAGDVYSQYKVYFATINNEYSPTLENVTIKYSHWPITTLINPENKSSIIDNKPVFTWEFFDQDSSCQSAFQVIIDDDIDFESINYDSGNQSSTNKSWQITTGTSYTKLQDGNWYWKVRTKDSDGVWGLFSAPYILDLDSSRPASIISEPVNNSYCKILNTIYGTAIDSPSGSGINKVEISIQRLKDNYFWDAYVKLWATAEVWFPVSGTTDWSYDSSIIPWMSDSQYIIRSRAVDNFGNIEIPNSEKIILFDSIMPNSIIETPSDGYYLSSIETISGTASDTGGSGLEVIEIYIKRLDSSKYWTGSSWKSNVTWLTTTGKEQWSYEPSMNIWVSDIEYLIKSRASDLANNKESPGSEFTFMYDARPPTFLEISINNDDEYTNSNQVTLSLQSFDPGSGITHMSFSPDGFNWSAWEIYSTTRSYELLLRDGEHRVYFRTKDMLGNTANGVCDTIILDTSGPEEYDIVINDDDEFTNSPNVTLKISGSDSLSGVGELSFSFNSINWTGWISFMPEISMVIPVGDGEKTVYLRMKDNVGNIAESAFDTIILDTTPPHSLTLKINNGSLETNSTKVWLEIRAQDEYSGVYQMSFSTNGDYWSPWQNYSTNRQYNLPSVDGNKTIYYMVKDRLGNQAEPVYETIILNTTVPVTNVEPQKEKISEVSSSTILIISSIAVIIIFLIIIIILIIQRKKKRSKNLTSMATVTVKPTQQTDLASTSASKPTLTSTSTSTNTPTIITKSTTSSLKIISTAHPPVFSEVSEAAEGDVCMTCGQQTNYIKDQNKYYCFHCKKYE